METFHDDNGSDLRSTKRTVNSYEEKRWRQKKGVFSCKWPTLIHLRRQ